MLTDLDEYGVMTITPSHSSNGTMIDANDTCVNFTLLKELEISNLNTFGAL